MKTIGLARLGRDAEIRHTPSGDAVCNLSLAVNYGKKGDDGNRPTQWIDATLWGTRAEALAQYLTKGSVHCFTLDEMHIETFQKNDGTQGTKMAARVVDVELGPRASGDQGGAPAQRQAPPAAQRPAPQSPARGKVPNFTDMDDDIPF
jgi:single-strand DNA-binding protein